MGDTGLTAIRDTLARALDWDEARVRFETAVAGLPPALRAARPDGAPHTPWQLVEHLRLVLADLVDFAVNPAYAHTLAWPDDYWPSPDAQPDDAAWDESCTAVRGHVALLQELARDPAIDLLAPVPTGTPHQTYLRTLLLALDHDAYHVGQLVAVRHALGAWR